MTDLFERPPAPSQAPRTRAAATRQRRAARRRARRRRRAAIIVVVALLLVGGTGYVLATHASSIFGIDNPAFTAKDFDGPGSGSVSVTIEPGATGKDMGQALYDAGVVQSVKAFTNAYSDNENASKIQPGTHVLKLRMKAADAVALLISGENVDSTSIKVIPGQTAHQVFVNAAEKLGVSEADFTAAAKDTAATGLPASAKGNYEGWLEPGSYVPDAGETPTSLLKKMVGARIDELQTLGVAQANWEQVLTEASLIEREASRDEDRPKMAEVINNRIAQNMPLGIDAAVAYGAGKSGTELTKADLADASNPYNLRVHTGLPPTPISNPGTAAIKAVLSPATGNLMYWCTVNLDTGETKFAATAAEHQKNVDELRAWEKAHPGASGTATR